VPGPFWRRWWNMLRHAPRPLPADFRPPPLPPWAGPPESELGVAVPLRTIVLSRPRVVVAVVDCVAYSNGFKLGVSIRSKDEIDHRSLGFGSPMEREVKGTLRVGVRFADGRETTTSGHGPGLDVMAYYSVWREGREPEVPAGPVIAHGSGGGGGRRWDSEYWVWPLPPDGPVTVSCEWLAVGVELSSTEVDGGVIRRAGATSTSLWDQA
jgi:hypothetical protein